MCVWYCNDGIGAQCAYCACISNMQLLCTCKRAWCVGGARAPTAEHLYEVKCRRTMLWSKLIRVQNCAPKCRRRVFFAADNTVPQPGIGIYSYMYPGQQRASCRCEMTRARSRKYTQTAPKTSKLLRCSNANIENLFYIIYAAAENTNEANKVVQESCLDPSVSRHSRPRTSRNATCVHGTADTRAVEQLLETSPIFDM